ncbi:MAG: hypothetical protein MUF16_06045 [Burkholderiaceae bacterium]|jgi:hypothetical protein|nr:hypothetical protein [Burkholderiaceae bacterium]
MVATAIDPQNTLRDSGVIASTADAAEISRIAASSSACGSLQGHTLKRPGIAASPWIAATWSSGTEKNRVARAVVCQTQPRRAGREHHAGLGIHCIDHVGDVGMQAGMGRLFGLHRRLGSPLVERGLGRLHRGLTAFELGRADEALVMQFLEALEVGRGQRVTGPGRGQGDACRVLTQAQVPRVQAGQQLPGLDLP